MSPPFPLARDVIALASSLLLEFLDDAPDLRVPRTLHPHLDQPVEQPQGISSTVTS
jgi:hypothetical protein